MTFTIEYEQESDGRWLAEVVELSGVLTYGKTSDEAIAKAQALALRVLADRLEHGETAAEFVNISFAAAWVNGHLLKRDAFLPRFSASVGVSSENQALTKILSRPDWADVVFAFHDKDEVGPRMLARIAKHTGLRPEDL